MKNGRFKRREPPTISEVVNHIEDQLRNFEERGYYLKHADVDIDEPTFELSEISKVDYFTDVVGVSVYVNLEKSEPLDSSTGTYMDQKFARNY